MEPEKPNKPDLKAGAGVTVVEEAPPSVKENIKEEIGLLKKKTQKESVLQELEDLKDPTKTQIYKSMFRVKHEPTPRSRSLGVLTNVFLHLHPAKINRDAVRFSYTWGMGGITFYLFIVLTLTGVLLMFYYHPSKVQAFRDVLYLEHDVPFGKLLRNMHRWAAHLMVIAVELHMFRVFLTGSYKKPRNMCSSTAMTIKWAAQRCMLRSNLPKGTSCSRYRTSRKACTLLGW